MKFWWIKGLSSEKAILRPTSPFLMVIICSKLREVSLSPHVNGFLQTFLNQWGISDHVSEPWTDLRSLSFVLSYPIIFFGPQPPRVMVISMRRGLPHLYPSKKPLRYQGWITDYALILEDTCPKNLLDIKAESHIMPLDPRR